MAEGWHCQGERRAFPAGLRQGFALRAGGNAGTFLPRAQQFPFDPPLQRGKVLRAYRRPSFRPAERIWTVRTAMADRRDTSFARPAYGAATAPDRARAHGRRA